MPVHRSAPPTPHHSDSYAVLSGELRSAYSTEEEFRITTITNGEDEKAGGNRSLRNDLLLAADSVTNAMSTLVKELNSGKENLLFSICFQRSRLYKYTDCSQVQTKKME